MRRIFLKRVLHNFDCFFCFLANFLYIKKLFVWKKIAFGDKVHFPVLLREFSSNFFFLKVFGVAGPFFKFFWNVISFHSQFLTGFFVEINLIGLGYRVKRISDSLYRFFWGYANYIYLLIPILLRVEYSYRERNLIFFGFNSEIVNGVSTFLILLRQMSVYRIAGFKKYGKIIRLKAGKQRN